MEDFIRAFVMAMSLLPHIHTKTFGSQDTKASDTPAS
jgi:hypothetical protein